MFLMPMTVATFAALMAQIEHRAAGWNHLLALPIARWRVFAAKLAVALLAAAAMTALLLAGAWLGATLGGAVSGRPAVGNMPWARLARVVPMLLACTSLLTVLQLWIALRFASFVVPLGVGIAGTLIALSVAITHTDRAQWFPWVLPLTGLRATDPLALAGLVAIAVMVAALLMVLHLSRRSFR